MSPRVLHVGAAYPPAGRGGYEQQCADAVAWLAAAGWEQRVLTAEGVACEQDGELVARELPRHPSAPVPVSPGDAAAGERAAGEVLEAHLDDLRPDVVCLWRLGELAMSIPGRVAARGIPAVGVVGDRWMVDGPSRDPWCRVRGRVPAFGPLAEWLPVSAWLQGSLAAAGITLGGTALATPGPDRTVFAPRPAAPPWRGELLVPGRLSPLKGAPDCAAALAALDGCRMTFVGDGDPEVVLGPARRLGVADRVTVLPAESRERVAARMAAADAVLFCVRWDEPWGLVGLEALSVGVPVVGTATGGSATFLRDGETALVVPRQDPAAIARAVGRLAEDAALRSRLVRAGLREADRWPADAAPRAVEVAFHRALATRPAARRR